MNRVFILFASMAFTILVSCQDDIALGSDANEAVELKVRNYLGNCENIHPKVLHFDSGLWGHEFWMSYTPYPKGNTNAENPCIAVSADGIKWATPEGCHNPLATNKALNGGYNSDSHLLVRTNGDTPRMECWYRPVKKFGNTYRDAIFRRTTTDGGRTWTEPEALINYDDWYDSYGNTLSPAIIFEEGKYRMWFVGTHGGQQRVWYSEAEDGKETDAATWSANRRPLDITWPEGKHPWHLDVTHSTEHGYELAVCINDERGNGNAADLYYIVSADNVHFSTPILIVRRSQADKALDRRSIYRSSLVHAHGRYYIYYSSIDMDNHRHLSLTWGDNVTHLVCP